MGILLRMVLCLRYDFLFPQTFYCFQDAVPSPKSPILLEAVLTDAYTPIILPSHPLFNFYYPLCRFLRTTYLTFRPGKTPTQPTPKPKQKATTIPSTSAKSAKKSATQAKSNKSRFSEPWPFSMKEKRIGN